MPGRTTFKARHRDGGTIAASRERQRQIDAAARKKANIAGLLSVRGREGVTMVGGTTGPAPAARQKTPGKVRQAIRDSARGEACTVRLPGCPSDPEQTIWSHYPGAAGGKGGQTKSHDACGCYACTYCDAVVDGQRPRPEGLTREAVMLAWHEGHMRSLVRLAQKGLL